MAVDLNEVKINVRSLLTSSQKPLSILQLQRDYREQEGSNLPYRSLGFSSVIELLQNIPDVVTVPPNPNESSMLSLVVGDKTNHLRMLVVKQKSNSRKKKGRSNMNSHIVHQVHNGNINFSRCNSYNNSKTNNNSMKKYQNTRSDYHRSNNSSISSNQLNQSCSSSSKSYSDLNRNGFSHNANSSYGYVTEKLRSDIERCILENQMLITLNKLMEIVTKHPDYLLMDVHSMHDLKDRVKSFLNINDSNVSLKNTLQFKTYIQQKNYDTDAQIKPLIPSDANKLSYNIPAVSQINGDSKNVIDSRPYEWNDQNVISTLYTRLKIDDFKKDIPQNMCKSQSLMKTFQSGFNNSDKNSDTVKADLLKNIEYVKKRSEIRKNTNVDTGLMNEKKSQSCSIVMSGDNPSNNSNSFSHSTKKKYNNDTISLNGNQYLPELVRNIGRIFKVYCKGVNIKNFKFIYTEMYCTILNPIDFGFNSIKHMLNTLDQMIEVRNNVLYTKNEFKFYEKEDLENDNKCLLKNIYLNNETISTSIEQPILSFNQNKEKMLLVETYNPSLFFLQLQFVELDRLMNQMKRVYETKTKNYLVKSNQILPGSFYATSYTSFLNLKQWYRVRVLREVNSTTIEVIYVDYGTVDNIPKTELRFLNYKFCILPCQAIQCCLTGYNELDSIAPEVTKAFLKIINNTQVLVMVDDHFILSKQCQILHVTLFQYKSNDSKKLENINNELTIWHLNRLRLQDNF